MGNLWFSASLCLSLLAVVSLGRNGLSLLSLSLPQSEILYEQTEMILGSSCLFLIELLLWAVT